MIKFSQVKSATIAATNENDEARVYAISALVEVNNGVATNVREGKVTTLNCEEGESGEIATFNGWSTNALNTNLHNVSDEEQVAVFTAIKEFVKSLREEAANLVITL